MTDEKIVMFLLLALPIGFCVYSWLTFWAVMVDIGKTKDMPLLICWLEERKRIKALAELHGVRVRFYQGNERIRKNILKVRFNMLIRQANEQ